MNRLTPILLSLVLAWPVSLQARELRTLDSAIYKTLHFDSLDTDRGLSHPSVTAIIKDRRGFLWIGTQSGLNRYDGDAVKVFRHVREDVHSLPNEHITVLKRGRNHSLWVGTLGGGVAHLNLQTNTFDRIPFRDAASRTGTGIVIDLAQTPDGTLWVATEGGLGVLAKNGNEIRPIAAPGVHVRRLIEVGSGVLALTTGALYRYDRVGDPPQTIDIVGTTAANLQMLTPAGKGHFWVLGGGQLYKGTLEGARLNLKTVAPDPVSSPRALATDGWGNVWIGGIDGIEVYVIDAHKFVPPADYLKRSERSVRSLYMDGTEIWIGTNLEGVKYANLARQVAVAVPTPGGAPVVTEYTLADGRILLGTHPGLYYFDPETLNFQSLQLGAAKAPSVVSFLETGTRVWFSSTGGLGWIDPATGKVTATIRQPFEYPLLITATAGGQLVMGTGEELVRIDAGGKHIVSRKPMTRTLARLDLGKGRILIGGFYGADVYDLSCDCTQNLLEHYPETPPIVTALQRGDGDRYWLGTHDQGLIEMRWDGEHIPVGGDFHIFDRSRGLAADAIGGIVKDNQGQLWLSTTAGFSQFDPASQTFTNYFADSGAARKGYIIGASARTGDGTIVFGSLHTLTLIPDVKHTAAPLDEPVITDIKLANRSLQSRLVNPKSPLDFLAPYAKHLVLPYGSPALSLDFSTLTYPPPNGLNYWYRLVPLENSWIAIARGRRSATYTSLSPGDYRFEVTNDPLHHNVDTFSISITPPWYMKTWVIVVAILLGVVIVWLGIRLRLMSMRKRAERLSRVVEHRTAELKHANDELKVALEQVKTLRGIVPICASCKKIRDDDGYWQQLEIYMREHTEAEFSHGICDDCMKKLYSTEAPP